MSIVIEPWTPDSRPRLGALAAHPSLQPEFERLLGHSLGETLGDPLCPEAFRRLATWNGEDAAFAITFVVRDTEQRPFASVRIGVLEPFRRRGIAAAIWKDVTGALLRDVPGLTEIESSALIPQAGSEAFLDGLGLARGRRYWLMQRPGRSVEEPAWPDGITLRPFDGSDRDVNDWSDVFNRAWKEQDHGILVTPDDVRQLLASGSVQADGMFFAIAEGTPVGFVRDQRHATRGEVAVIGVLPEWRGRGLGRALLRFGTQWLLERGAEPVTLLVDGNNERALGLYRGEGFEVLRTRQVWARPVTDAERAAAAR